MPLHSSLGDRERLCLKKKILKMVNFMLFIFYYNKIMGGEKMTLARVIGQWKEMGTENY